MYDLRRGHIDQLTGDLTHASNALLRGAVSSFNKSAKSREDRAEYYKHHGFAFLHSHDLSAGFCLASAARKNHV